jgi:hypothetical protein
LRVGSRFFDLHELPVHEIEDQVVHAHQGQEGTVDKVFVNVVDDQFFDFDLKNWFALFFGQLGFGYLWCLGEICLCGLKLECLMMRLVTRARFF